MIRRLLLSIAALLTLFASATAPAQPTPQRIVAVGDLHGDYAAWLDIAPHGVDKGTALARVYAELGIEGDRVFVAGDGRNDVGMFAWARSLGGRAVAMGQAPDDVKDAAGEVTADVADGGLALALDTLTAYPGVPQVKTSQ